MKKLLTLILFGTLLVSCGETTTTSNNITSKDNINEIDRFISIRDYTLNLSGYQYNEELSINTEGDASITTIDFPDGNSSSTVNKASSEVKYYEVENNSGALFYDGTEHTYLKNNLEVIIKQNQDGEVTKYKSNNITGDYEIDYSTFAKAIFKYTKNDILSVTKVENSTNKYKIETKTNASKIAANCLNFLDNKIIKLVVSQLLNVPAESDGATNNMYVTYQDNLLSSYEYNFNTSVTISYNMLSLTISLDIIYRIDFLDYIDNEITLPSIPGLIIDSNSINSTLNTTKNIFTNYKSLTNSSYDYLVKTDIEGFSEDLSVTVDGETKRNIVNNTNYFVNEYEVDQKGYKDTDGDDTKDYQGARGITSDNKIYDINNPIIGFNSYLELDSNIDLSLDYFYFMPDNSLYETGNVNVIQRSTKNEVSYIDVLLNANGVKYILDLLSKSIRLKWDDSIHYNIFGEFEASSIVVGDNSYIKVGYKNSSLVSISIKLEGEYTSTIQDETITNAKYQATVTIETTTKGENYTAPSDKKDLI